MTTQPDKIFIRVEPFDTAQDINPLLVFERGALVVNAPIVRPSCELTIDPY